MSTSVSSVVSHFPSAQNGFTTTLASTISSGATTVPLNSVAGYTNGQVAVMIVDPSDATKKQTFTGIVDTSGVQLTSVVWTAGTNQTHSGGATVVDYASATHISMISKGLQVQHSQAGAHTAVTATSLAATGDISSSAGKITTTTVSKLEDTGVALSTYRNESEFPYTASGGVWTGDSIGSTRAASMTAWAGYINGQRGTISAVTARTFTASKDTYVDVLNSSGVFTLVYTEATNNAASPALAANSIRIAIIVTGAGSIATTAGINQGKADATLPTSYVTSDSLGNKIYNKNPAGGRLGFRLAAGVTATTSEPTLISLVVNVPKDMNLKLIAQTKFHTGSGAGDDACTYFIKEGSTVIKDRRIRVPATIDSAGITVIGEVFATAGSHTYLFTADNDAFSSVVTNPELIAEVA